MPTRIWRIIRELRSQRSAIAALAVGTGAVLALLTVADGLVNLSSFWERPGRVALELASPTGPTLQFFRFVEYKAIRQSPAVVDVSAFARTGAVVRLGDLATPITCSVVTENYFELRQDQAWKGRLFATQLDSANSGSRPVVINDRLARRIFADEPVGQSLTINRTDFVVIGVMKEHSGRNFGVEPDAWIPITAATGVYPDSRPVPIEEELGAKGGASFVLEARLRAGMSLAEANRQLSGLHFERRGPLQTVRFQPANAAVPSTLRSPLSQALQVSAVGLAFFLLVAVGNVAILMTQRVLEGAHERSLRYLLGATNAQLVTQVLLGAVAMAFAASLLGTGISVLLVGVIRSQLPEFLGIGAIPLLPRFPVLLAAFLVTQACGLLAAAVPIAFVLRPQFVWRLRTAGTSSSSRTTRSVESGVLILQVACALVLVTWALALVGRWHNLVSADLGLVPADVQVIDVHIDPAVRSLSQRHDLYQRALGRIEHHPNVRAAALASVAPLTPPRDALAMDERPAGTVYIDSVAATPRYFDVLGMRLIRGQAFEFPNSEQLILNEAALGLEQRRGRPLDGIAVDLGARVRGRTLIGIVRDVRRSQLEVTAEPTHFVPFMEADAKPAVVLIVATRAGDVPLGEIVSQLKSVDPEITVLSANSLTSRVARLAWKSRATATLSLCCGLAALVMAGMGVFAVIASSVARRYHDMAVRLALGAVPRRLIASLVWRAVAMSGLAMSLGSVVAMSQWSLLKAVDPLMPSLSLWFALSTSAGLLLSVVILACLCAARPVAILTPAKLFRLP